MPEVPSQTPCLSVQIPTRGRAEKLAECVRALAHQSLDPAEYEVVIGLDGADDQAGRLARQAWGVRPAQHLRIVEFERAGHLPIRRALVEMTRAPVVVFMNDDVIADPGLLAAHFEAHREAAARAGGSGIGVHGIMVVGDTPWSVPDEDSVFDRLVRETSLIFFFDAMRADRDNRWRDWGFRHFWTLNASAPRASVLAVGGVRAIPETYGHEDIELAFRMQERLGMPVVFRPEARGVHNHRYRPVDVMAREVRLGAASWRFALANPDFGRALFGREVASESEVEYSREFVARERAAAERLAVDLERLGTMRAPADLSGELLGILSRQFLLLKRHLWRTGLLEAADADGPDQRPVG